MATAASLDLRVKTQCDRCAAPAQLQLLRPDRTDCRELLLCSHDYQEHALSLMDWFVYAIRSDTLPSR